MYRDAAVGYDVPPAYPVNKKELLIFCCKIVMYSCKMYWSIQSELYLKTNRMQFSFIFLI